MPSLFVTINASINGLVSLSSIIGNAIIIITFARTKSIQNVTNMFLIQLSISDLAKATLILPIKVYNQYNDVKTFDNSYCQVSGVITTLTTILTVSYLATIAMARYFKILKWCTFQRVFSFGRGIIYSSLIIAAVFALALLPVLGVGQYSYSKFHGACFTNWDSHNILFRSIFYVCNIGISFPVLIFCYWRIFRFLRRHKKRLLPSKEKACGMRMVKKTSKSKYELEDKKTTTTSFDARNSEKSAKCQGKNLQETSTIEHIQAVQIAERKETDVSFEGENPVQRKLDVIEDISNEISEAATSNDNEIQINRKELKIARKDINITWILFLGVVSYVLCWFPATITTILSLSKVIKPSEVQLYSVVTMVELKLLLNPLIYGVLNTQFRQATKTLFCQRD